MKIRTIVCSFVAAFFMTFSAFAGTVELQDTAPVYTVREGVALTEEEQRAIDATLMYFMNNPSVGEVVLTSRDYPSISAKWFNSLMREKIKTFTDEYTIQTGEGTEILNMHCAWAGLQRGPEGNCEVIVSNRLNNRHSEKACTPYELYAWLNYTYDVVPQLGVYDGMDELQAIDIFNNWICSLMSYNYTGDVKYTFLQVYESGLGKCNDYAFLFKALCQGAGIDCVRASGSNHAWNEVMIDGQAYEIDVCWNDGSDSGANRYKYYMLPREAMAQYPSHGEVAMRM